MRGSWTWQVQDEAGLEMMYAPVLILLEAASSNDRQQRLLFPHLEIVIFSLM